MKKLYDAPMPVYWASYLINDDASGLEDGEQSVCDAYLEQQGFKEIFLDNNEESYFSWSYNLYGGNASGGDLLNYRVTLK